MTADIAARNRRSPADRRLAVLAGRNRPAIRPALAAAGSRQAGPATAGAQPAAPRASAPCGTAGRAVLAECAAGSWPRPADPAVPPARRFGTGAGTARRWPADLVDSHVARYPGGPG